MRTHLHLAGVVALLALVAGCGEDSSQRPATTPGGVDWPADVDEVYVRAEARLREMRIDHVLVSANVQGAATYEVTRQLWLDAGGDRYRAQSDASGKYADGSPLTWHTTTIGLPDATWTTDTKQLGAPVSPVRCHGAGVAVSALLGCPGPTETSTTTLRHGEVVGGEPTVVLVTEGSTSGSDETTTFHRETVVGALSGLPLAEHTTGTVTSGRAVPLSAVATFVHEAIDPSSLADDWFDPEAAGLGSLAELLALPNDVAVPWMGERWTPEGDLPVLTLARVERSTGEGLYDVTLSYGTASDRFGPAVVQVLGWTRAAWDRADRSAVQVCDTLMLGEREVRIGCDDTGRAVGAAVFEGDWVAEIHAPSTTDATGEHPSPYANHDAFVQVAEAVVWHVPTTSG